MLPEQKKKEEEQSPVMDFSCLQIDKVNFRMPKRRVQIIVVAQKHEIFRNSKNFKIQPFEICSKKLQQIFVAASQKL